MRFGIKTKIKSAFVILTGCKILKKTQWYRNMLVDPDHEIYPDNTWYRTHDERNYDLVNLGSSGGKWAFDYSDLDLKAMNWAQQPQTLLEDYNLLRHYHSILRKGGYVIITIMPFTGLNKETGLLDAFKYVNLDCQGEPIQPHMYSEACRYAKYPILFKKKAIKALIRCLFGKESNADKYAYTKVLVQIKSDNICDLGFGDIKSRDLVKALDSCKQAYILGVTIGIGADRLISRLSLTSPAEGFITDALASATAESLCDYADNSLRGTAEKPFRYAPGYGDMPLTYQPEILKALNADYTLGITLNSSLLMTPMKSITAIMGIKE